MLANSDDLANFFCLIQKEYRSPLKTSLFLKKFEELAAIIADYLWNLKMHVLMSISFTVGPDSSKKNILIGERLMKAELRRVILHEIQRERILDRFHYDFIAKLQ